MTDSQAILTVWERGLTHAPDGRAEAMLQLFDTSGGIPRSIGERNRRLLDLHARLFGDELDLTSRCPQCAATVQFDSRCSALIADAPDEIVSHGRLVIDGHVIEFRLPEPSDVALVAPGANQEEFARQLARRCIAGSVAANDLADSVVDALSRRMETLDPLAVVSFLLECPECATRWTAPLDVEHVLWTKVEASAERLLLDVDALARAYGWTEGDVLALPPIRRAAYLQLAGA